MVFGRIVDRESSRVRRRGAVIAHFLAMTVAFVAWWFSASAVDGGGHFWPLTLVFLAFAIVGGLIFAAVKNSTQRIAERWGEDGLDERQREVRDRSYRLAYRVLAVLLIVVLVYVQFALLASLPLPGRDHASIFFPFGIWLTTVLPTTIIAWTEPDPGIDD